MSKGTAGRSDILEALARKPQLVSVDGLGSVYVKPMSYQQRQSWTKAVLSEETDESRCMNIVCECLVNELGKPLFSPEEAAQLADGDGGIVQDIFTQVLTVSGLWRDAAKVAKKNSSKTRTSTSPTG